MARQRIVAILIWSSLTGAMVIPQLRDTDQYTEANKKQEI
jgi:hypothetical protein